VRIGNNVWCRHRKKKFVLFFPDRFNNFCNNVSDLMHTLRLNIYETNEWRLFIEFSKRNLKVVFHNEEEICISTYWALSPLKENENLQTLLEAIDYE